MMRPMTCTPSCTRRTSVLFGVALGLAAPAAQITLPRAALADEGAEATAIDFKAAREQAIHYYRQNKTLFVRAVGLLRDAAKTPDGGKDWKTTYWLAKIANENNILEEAFPWAKVSLANAKNDGQRQKSDAIVQYLSKSFGGVTFTQDERQTKTLKAGYIIIDVERPLINKQKKEVFAAIKERFGKTKVELPKTLYLPFGEYRANGAPFKIQKGEEAKAVLFLFAEPGGEGGMSWPVIAGIGVGAAALVAGVGALIFITDDHQKFEVGTVVTSK